MKKNNNLIAISGKIGSGKDTVGKIIQYLVGENKYDKEEWYESLEDFCKDTPGENSFDSGFKIKKFADKLKDIVCLLLSCTREQLEDQEFKEKELGEEWWKYEQYDKSINEWSNTSKNFYDRLNHVKNAKFRIIKLTPRLLLQLLGTECGREIIHPNIWINSLMSDYKAISGYMSSDMTLGAIFYGEDGNVTERVVGNKVPGTAKDTRIFPKWIITDLRFPNEYDAIKDNGGITVRITRNNSAESQSTHESETALDNYKTHDYEITNDGSLHDLYLSANTFYVTFINTKYND